MNLRVPIDNIYFWKYASSLHKSLARLQRCIKIDKKYILWNFKQVSFFSIFSRYMSFPNGQLAEQGFLLDNISGEAFLNKLESEHQLWMVMMCQKFCSSTGQRHCHSYDLKSEYKVENTFQEASSESSSGIKH